MGIPTSDNRTGGSAILALAPLLLAAGVPAAHGETTQTDQHIPLLRVSLRVQAPPTDGRCPDVMIRVTPVELLPDPPHSVVDREFLIPVSLRLSDDATVCDGKGTTIPLAPGRWTFKALLPSHEAQCVRYVAPRSSETVKFQDGESGCA